MSEFNKYSTDGGATFIDVEDSNAVHWGDQSKGYVRKNLFYPTIFYADDHGIKFAVNDDNTVSLTGSKTSTSFLALNDLTYLLPAGNYKVSGCPSGGSSSTYELRCETEDGGYRILAQDVGNGATLNLNSDTHIRVIMRVNANTDMTGKVYKPMITLASVPDSDYAHYESYNIELSNKLSYADNTVLGTKNLNKYPYDGTQDSITADVTINDDGSITIDGEQTGTGQFYIHRRWAYDFQLPSGTYKLTSRVTSSMYIAVDKNNQTGQASQGSTNLGADNGTGLQFTLDKLSDIQMILFIPAGTYDNVVIYPMIRLASDTDNTYAPYAMTNRELTKTVDGITTKTFIFESEAIAGNSYRTASKSAANGTLTPIGVIGYSINGGGNTHACLFRCDINGTDVRVGIINLSSSEITPSVDVTVLYKG